MRYALRNQDQIAAKMGKEFLADRKKELGEFFPCDDPVMVTENIKGKDYCTLTISGHVYIITDRQYDILKLAYYGEQ